MHSNGISIAVGPEWGQPLSFKSPKLPVVLFRNGAIGVLDKEIFVKDGTEAKVGDVMLVFREGQWNETAKEKLVPSARGSAGLSAGVVATMEGAKEVGASEMGFPMKEAEKHKLIVCQLRLNNAGGDDVRLDWKKESPIVERGTNEIKFCMVAWPWDAGKAGGAAGGVGQYSTAVRLKGSQYGGVLDLGEGAACTFLALSKPGSQTGDHLFVPANKVNVTLAAGESADLKLIIPPPREGEEAGSLILPGCSPKRLVLKGKD